MLRFDSTYSVVVVVSGWRILHHAVSALTMMKIVNFSTKNENDALLLDMYIRHDIDMKKVKEIVITPILKTKIEVAKGALLHLFRRCTIEYSEVTKAEI